MFRLNYMKYLKNTILTNKRINLVKTLMTTQTKMSQASMKNNNEKDQHLVWIDLEMTGLDLEKDKIIEIACLITDKDLNIVAEGPDLVINQPDHLLDNMNAWCKKTHGESGLTKAVRESKVDVKEAERLVLAFLNENQIGKGKCPLAGNSVHVDRQFLSKYMNEFVEHLHYRIVDVSSIKELANRWYPELGTFKKKNTHRALDDIKESIEELKFYRSNIFK